ncbi:DUF4135 domain-containing protein [Streptomyces virginiae]|uniref:DUF4135 domain-containing protein n=1 Tax=Streptomyces virginiae TaxID=1961 RepID=UPI0036902CED
MLGASVLQALSTSQLVNGTSGGHSIDLKRARTSLTAVAASWLPASCPSHLLTPETLPPAIGLALDALTQWARRQPCSPSCDQDRCAPLFAAVPTAMPSLIRLLATRLDYWSRALAELAQRLEQDRLLLRSAFGLNGDLARLDFPAGDEHHCGRATAVLHFTSGAAVAYKPRPQSMIIRLRAISDHLRGQEPTLAVSFPEALDRGSYGWALYVEAIDPATEPDFCAQYRRLGQAAALTWALAGRDIHLGNIVLSENALHIIDEEVFGLGVVTDNPALPTTLREELRFFESSPVHTGVFPYLTPLPGRADGIDFSPYSRLRTALTDKPAPAGPHELLDGDAAAFLHGYEEMLQAIADSTTHSRTLHHHLKAMAAERCRLVPLPTARYSELLGQSLAEEHLVSGRAREAFFTNHLQADSAFKPWRNALIADEVAVLFEGDVPLFHAPVDSRFVQGTSGSGYALLDHTGDTVLRHRTARLTAELPSLRWQAAASLACAARNRHPAPTFQPDLDPAADAPGDPAKLVHAAHILLARARDLAVTTLDGHPAWADTRHDARRKWHIGHGGTSIHSGSSGILLAALLLQTPFPKTPLATTADDLTMILAKPWLDETEQLAQSTGTYVLAELSERLTVATELLIRATHPQASTVMETVLAAITRSLPHLALHPDQPSPALLALAASARRLPAAYRYRMEQLIQEIVSCSPHLLPSYDARLARQLTSLTFPYASVPPLHAKTAAENDSAFFRPWVRGFFPERAAQLHLARAGGTVETITQLRSDIAGELRATPDRDHSLADGTAGRISLLRLLGEHDQADGLAMGMARRILPATAEGSTQPHDQLARPGLLTGLAGSAYELARSAGGNGLPSLLLPPGTTVPTVPSASHHPRSEENPQ